MDLDEGVEMVGFAGEHGLDLAAFGLGMERAQRRFGVGDDRLVVFRLAQFDQPDLVGKFTLEMFDRGDLAVQMLALAHQLLRLLRHVPEVGLLGRRVQFGKAGLGAIPVKDASSAGRRPA